LGPDEYHQEEEKTAISVEWQGVVECGQAIVFLGFPIWLKNEGGCMSIEETEGEKPAAQGEAMRLP